MNKYNTLNPCSFCPATADKKKPKRLWYTSFKDALWKNQVYNPVQWRNAQSGIHRLFQVFCFLSCLNVDVDELHVLYLGTTQYLLGSVLWLMVYDLLEESPQNNLDTIWKKIIAEYKKLGTTTQYTSFKLSFSQIPISHATLTRNSKGVVAK